MIDVETCADCKRILPVGEGEDEVEYGPDPYASEIYDDDTPLWQCGRCHRLSADEI